MTSQLLEAIMILLFGVAWPASIMKSYRARTARGKSLVFLFCVAVGYLAGIASKFVAGTVNYVLFFYALNLAMVAVDIALYFRNRRLDRMDPVVVNA